MRDEHRPKQELVHEVTGLRKQILDLKDAMTARCRVEDALRAAMALLHTLIDNAPAGLCLFRRDGTLLTANRPFARMLGYESPAELQRSAESSVCLPAPRSRRACLARSAADHRVPSFGTRPGPTPVSRSWRLHVTTTTTRSWLSSRSCPRRILHRSPEPDPPVFSSPPA